MNGADCNQKSNFIIKVVVLFSLVTIAFYLLTEHRAHLLAYSSYILFFGYILLHLFMCGRHGKHGEHGGHCGHGHGEHKHDESEKHEDSNQQEHNQEKLK